MTAGASLGVSGAQDKTLRIWDLSIGECLAIVPLSAVCQAVAIEPFKLVVAGTEIGEIVIFDLHGFRAAGN